MKLRQKFQDLFARILHVCGSRCELFSEREAKASTAPWPMRKYVPNALETRTKVHKVPIFPTNRKIHMTHVLLFQIRKAHQRCYT